VWENQLLWCYVWATNQYPGGEQIKYHRETQRWKRYTPLPQLQTRLLAPPLSPDPLPLAAAPNRRALVASPHGHPPHPTHPASSTPQPRNKPASRPVSPAPRALPPRHPILKCIVVGLEILLDALAATSVMANKADGRCSPPPQHPFRYFIHKILPQVRSSDACFGCSDHRAFISSPVGCCTMH